MCTGVKGRCLRGVTRRVILLVFGLSLLWSSGASAALYMKFAGIDGESLSATHRGWSDITNMDWYVKVKNNGATVFSDVNWTMVQDSSFAPLFYRISQGENTPEVKIDFTFPTSAGELSYFYMEFDNASLTDLSLGGVSNELPIVTGSFAYDNLSMEYTEYDATGERRRTIEAYYNLLTGEGDLYGAAALFAQGMSGPTVTHTPIPPSFLLLGTGLLGLGVAGYRRKKKS